MLSICNHITKPQTTSDVFILSYSHQSIHKQIHHIGRRSIQLKHTWISAEGFWLLNLSEKDAIAQMKASAVTENVSRAFALYPNECISKPFFLLGITSSWCSITGVRRKTTTTSVLFYLFHINFQFNSPVAVI